MSSPISPTLQPRATPARRTTSRSPRLRASPNFVLAFAMDGRAYVSKEVEPYIQYWLAERERVVLSLFSGARGETIARATAAYLRLRPELDAARETKLVAKAIAEMRDAGILTAPGDDTSRYDAEIAADYRRFRPFPVEIADFIASRGGLKPESRVLDLAGGPGSLALALARTSRDVTLMELSRGFIAAAEAEAKSTGVQLATSHESCNRLVYHDGEYDLITISQALHWLDDVMVCRGVSRILRDRGSFHVILASLDVDAGHPLAYLLGDDSILGAKAKQPFMAQARALMRRLALLFEALDAPDVERIDPNQRWQTGDDAPPSRVHPVGITHFRQTRPFGPGFARAFLTPTHIVRTGIAPDVFWRDLEARCAGASAQALEGHHDWAVLHLARRTPDAAPGPDGAMVEIGWDGPPLG